MPSEATPAERLSGDFQTAIGPIKFDDKGDLVTSPYRLFSFERAKVRAGANAMRMRAARRTSSRTLRASASAMPRTPAEIGRHGPPLRRAGDGGLSRPRRRRRARGRPTCSKPQNSVQTVNGIVLSGGSSFGLDAASGVQALLRERGVGICRRPVPNPDRAQCDPVRPRQRRRQGLGTVSALPRPRIRSRGKRCPYGSNRHGRCRPWRADGRLKGGLGSASCVLESGVTIGALVAVNAIGSVTLHRTRHFWAAPFEIGDEFGGLGYPSPMPEAANEILLKYRTRRSEPTRPSA